MSQFFYKKDLGDKKEEITKPYFDCFSIDCVVRGFWVNEETFVVILNDGHEATNIIKPAVRNKEGKVVGEPIKERQYMLSEILLDYADAMRFKKLFEITSFEEESTYELGEKQPAMFADQLMHQG